MPQTSTTPPGPGSPPIPSMPPSFLPHSPELPLRQTLCTALPTSLTPASSLLTHSSAHCHLWPPTLQWKYRKVTGGLTLTKRRILFLSHLDTSAQRLTVRDLKSPSAAQLPASLSLPSLRAWSPPGFRSLHATHTLQDFQYHPCWETFHLSPAQTRLPDRQSPDSSASHGRARSLRSSPKRLPLLCTRAPRVLQPGAIQWRPSAPLPERPPTPPPYLHSCPHPDCTSHCKVVF